MGKRCIWDEGRTYKGLNQMRVNPLKDNRGKILVLSTACEEDLMKKNHLVPFYHKEGTVIADILMSENKEFRTKRGFNYIDLGLSSKTRRP